MLLRKYSFVQYLSKRNIPQSMYIVNTYYNQIYGVIQLPVEYTSRCGFNNIQATSYKEIVFLFDLQLVN